MIPFFKKRLLTLWVATALFCCFGVSFGQGPINNNCGNAVQLTIGSAVSGTTIGATASNVAYCQASVTGPGVWYKITGNGGSLKLSTCDNATFDSKISVYSGNCGSLYCVAGNDDSPNCSYFTSEVEFTTEAGKIYYAMVHGFGTTVGNFTISATSSAIAAPNATCNDALGMATGSVISGSTVGGSVSSAPTVNGVTITSPGVWYTFQGNGGPAILETCGGLTNFDTRLSIYTSVCGSLTGITANDDYCALQSHVEIPSTVQGETYKVLVHGFGTQTGEFGLKLSRPNPPANDMPCNATAIPMGSPIAFTNVDALADAGEVTPGAGDDPNTCRQANGWCFFETQVQNSVWFTLQAPASGCINLLVQGFDVQIALWKATDCNDYSTYQEISANDDSGNLLNPSLPSSGPAALVELACLDPGATYYLQIDGFNGASGMGTISMSDCGNTPLSLDAGGCQTLYSGYAGTEGDTAFLVATPTGGFPPYSMHWGSDPSVLYGNPEFRGIAVQPTQNTGYTVTVTDSKGCSVATIVNVAVEDLSGCTYSPGAGEYRTQTQGGWGGNASGNNPGSYRDANWSGAFPNGLVVGCTHTITFTSSAAIQAFLRGGGSPGPLTQSYTNPPGGGRNAIGNVLANQVVTLALSLGFDAYDKSFGSGDTWLGDLIIASGEFAGMTVNELYGHAEKGLGGCSNLYDFSKLNNAVTAINQNFVDGNSAGSYLVAPGVNVCENGSVICAKPEEVDNLLARGATLGACNNACDNSNVSFPPPPACEDLVLTVTGDIFADFENSWTLQDMTTMEIIDAREPGEMVGFMTETMTYCLDPTHCYEFVMFDQFGDGFFFGGSYSISFVGQNMNSTFVDPFFNPMFMETQLIGACGSREAALAAKEGVEIISYPNPFRDKATIKFMLPETSQTKVEVYTITGQKVETVFNGQAEANREYEAVFSGNGHMSGLYFYKLTTDKGLTQEGKMILQK